MLPRKKLINRSLIVKSQSNSILQSPFINKVIVGHTIKKGIDLLLHYNDVKFYRARGDPSVTGCFTCWNIFTK